MEYTWKEMLKDSSWVTIAWEWLQSLLGRLVDFILWVTMIFACYQLIPGAPMPAQSISVFMFVMQFIALDIGGMSLNQIGQRHGLNRWSYTRVVAYACIFVTLVTIVFAGIQHAMHVSKDVTTWIEVTLVIARSVLTVLYGQAVRAIKTIEQTEDDRVAMLEQEVSTLRIQLDTQQKRVSTGQQEVSNLRSQLDSKQKEVSRLSVQLDIVQTQLDGKHQELGSIKETFISGQQWQEQRAQQLLEAEQRRVSTLQEQLDSQQEKMLRVQQEASNLRLQLMTERAKLSAFQEQLDSKKLPAIQHRLSSVQSTGVQLDTRKNGQEMQDNAIAEQIRSLLKEEPGLSGRAIAARIGCSPTTASAWKKAIEQEMSIVPRLQVINT
jgi:molecular chaperone GrpE (heat shock protein)